MNDMTPPALHARTIEIRLIKNNQKLKSKKLYVREDEGRTGDLQPRLEQLRSIGKDERRASKDGLTRVAHCSCAGGPEFDLLSTAARP